METTQHDFNAPIQKTAVDLALVILDELNKHKEMLLTVEPEGLTPEQKTAFEKDKKEKETDFGIAILKIIASTDIPADYAGFPLELIIGILSKLNNYVGGFVRQTESEIMSRFIGVKSPTTNTYAKDCATFAQLVGKLEEIREATGGKDEDYFISK